MRVLRGRISVGFDRRTRGIRRRKYDRLRMVMRPHANVREDRVKRIAELIGFKFVAMVRVRSGRPARLRVISLVRRRNQQHARNLQHAPRFFEQFRPMLHMLDHFERRHQIEAALHKR